ncbi:MAG: hypothetical protein A2Z11_01775 [Candidatus Woykebacteria bacterium RBG_16_43_9]|uniref:Uncharacterized protein n=1 Tax=Candidatus Woykebacteria bacterium RBG_16_43_9 TaxID=1802596 RepID=A0A1G1WBX4_9BACT|nr:MAG: hypothetical protein A2Z11_01775 [Candidatus Woykebacteria bacterium RBG_16_43_9]
MISKGIFFDLGVYSPEENADQLAEKIAEIVGMKGEDCAKVWGRVSKLLDDPKFRETLKDQLS